jgi:fumarate reductase subunit C
MLQPVGRVLGSSAFNSVWLQAPPIICALDILALFFRLLAYSTVLHAAPRKAVLVIGMDRFHGSETDHVCRKTTIIATTLRLVRFLLSILPPTYMFGAWGNSDGR